MTRYILFFITSIVVFLSACDDDTVIGQDLLDDEEIGTSSKDDFVLSAKTIEAEDLYTYINNRDTRIYFSGELKDPVFGDYSSDIYLALGLNAPPNFGDSKLDSIVMILQYDSTSLYGDTLATQNLEVFRITEDFYSRDSIESQESFDFDMIPLGSKSFVPNLRDSLEVQDRATPEENDFIRVPPQLRVRLDDEFGKMLLADSMSAKNDTLLLEYLKGFYIRSRTDGTGILPLSMDASSFGGVNLYYTQGDTASLLYVYPFRTSVFGEFKKDIIGAPIEEFIEDETKGDSLLFVQSHKGFDIEFTLPDLSELDSAIINRATLTMTVADIPGDWDKQLSPDISQLLVSSIEEDGSRQLITDIAKSDLSDGIDALGGNPIETAGSNGEVLIQYKFNITDFIREVIDDDKVGAKFIISPLLRQLSVRNTVFYGPGHSTYPSKLRITYTNLK